MTDPLSPQPQSWYDDNRSRFQADSAGFELKANKCNHYIERKSWAAVECKKCKVGWIDNNHFILENGSITGVQ